MSTLSYFDKDYDHKWTRSGYSTVGIFRVESTEECVDYFIEVQKVGDDHPGYNFIIHDTTNDSYAQTGDEWIFYGSDRDFYGTVWIKYDGCTHTHFGDNGYIHMCTYGLWSHLIIMNAIRYMAEELRSGRNLDGLYGFRS
jgi:hypothetical protein